MPKKTPEEIAAEEAAKAMAAGAAENPIASAIPSMTAAFPLGQQQQQQPPIQSAAKPKRIKVRAVSPLGEEVDGEIRHFPKGAEFTVSAERAKALGPLVEIL